jgi:hypothetical protein
LRSRFSVAKLASIMTARPCDDYLRKRMVRRRTPPRSALPPFIL